MKRLSLSFLILFAMVCGAMAQNEAMYVYRNSNLGKLTFLKSEIDSVVCSQVDLQGQRHEEMTEVISEDNSYRMIDMMRAVIDGGTGSRLKGAYGMKGDICGKTGTTNSNSDGWFIAFTPELVSGAWVGGEDCGIHFDSTSLGQGAAAALPIWAYFMKKVYADHQLGYSDKPQFAIPKDFDFCSTSEDTDVNDIQEVYF